MSPMPSPSYASTFASSGTRFRSSFNFLTVIIYSLPLVLLVALPIFYYPDTDASKTRHSSPHHILDIFRHVVENHSPYSPIPPRKSMMVYPVYPLESILQNVRNIFFNIS